jgi:hypothetical protein
VKFAKTDNQDFEVNFAEEIGAEDDTCARGLIQGKQIWLDVHHTLTDAELSHYRIQVRKKTAREEF